MIPSYQCVWFLTYRVGLNPRAMRQFCIFVAHSCKHILSLPNNKVPLGNLRSHICSTFQNSGLENPEILNGRGKTWQIRSVWNDVKLFAFSRLLQDLSILGTFYDFQFIDFLKECQGKFFEFTCVVYIYILHRLPPVFVYSSFHFSPQYWSS